MRKQILNETLQTRTSGSQQWISGEQIETVAVTSENPATPIEKLFDSGDNIGWRAGEPGPQQIQITFVQPLTLSLIELEFREPTLERTQEFVIRWAKSPDSPRQEIVRQRWNFSPQGSTREHERFSVNLDGVLVLEFSINPDVSRSDTIASLARLRLA